MAKSFISDDEMDKLSPTSSKGFISDEEMDAMDKQNMAKAGQAGLEHFGNSAAMGYLPQLQAGAEKPMSYVLDKITGNHVSDDLPDYAQRRDENITRLEKQEKDHPVASTVGTIGGTVASAIPGAAAIGKLPGMAKLSTMAPYVAEGTKDATLASKVAALAGRTTAAAGSAAVQGALSNPGDVEGEVSPLQLRERAMQGGLSAAIAAPLHMAGEGVSKVGSYISDRMKDKAEKLAFRALGPFKRQVNQNRDEINAVGREALDSGIVRWKPGSAATIEERAQDATEASGKALGDLTDKLISMEGQASSSGMSRKQIAEKLKEKLLSENPAGIPGIDKRNQTFGGMIEEFRQDPMIKKIAASQGISYQDAEKLALRSGYKPKPLSFSDLRKAKMAVQGTEKQDGLINWNRLKNADIPIDEQFHRALAGQLREGEESGAAAIERAFGGGKTGELERLKTQFGHRKTAASISGNRADSQRANMLLGLRDAVLASGGAAAGAGALGGAAGEFLDGHEGALKGAKIGAAIGGLGSKIARDYGAQMSSKTADALSRLFQKSPVFEHILSKNPTLIPQLVESMERDNKRKGNY